MTNVQLLCAVVVIQSSLMLWMWTCIHAIDARVRELEVDKRMADIARQIKTQPPGTTRIYGDVTIPPSQQT